MSLFFLLVCLGLLASTDSLLGSFSGGVPLLGGRAWPAGSSSSWRMNPRARPLDGVSPPLRPRPADDPAEPTRLPDWHMTWLASWPIVAAFGFLGFVQVALLWPTNSGGATFFDVNPASSMIVSRFEDPEGRRPAGPSGGPSGVRTFKPISRGAGSSYGELSRTWSYQFGRIHGPSCRWITHSPNGTIWRFAMSPAARSSSTGGSSEIGPAGQRESGTDAHRGGEPRESARPAWLPALRPLRPAEQPAGTSRWDDDRRRPRGTCPTGSICGAWGASQAGGRASRSCRVIRCSCTSRANTP